MIILDFSIDLYFYLLLLHVTIEIIARYTKLSLRSIVFILISGILIIFYRRYIYIFPQNLYSITNRLEHIAFTTAASIIIWEVIPTFLCDLKTKIITTFVLVNMIGFANEIFQHAYRYQNLDISKLSNDSMVDISVNLIISVVVVSYIFLVNRKVLS